MIGLVILATSSLFVRMHIEHSVWMLGFLVLTSLTFSLFGFIIGIWAKGFEQLQLIRQVRHHSRPAAGDRQSRQPLGVAFRRDSVVTRHFA